jgi:uncharacterized Zn finger protein (UPF0148 family)
MSTRATEASEPVEHCSNCGCRVGAWRQVHNGKVYCTAFCSRVAAAIETSRRQGNEARQP